METYLTEEERLEALKRWWNDNSQSVVVGLLLGAIAIVGWNMWQGNRRGNAEQAATVYQQLVKATEAKQSEPATKLAERLIQQYSGTAYSDFGRLFLAKLKVEAGDLVGAKKALEEILASTDDETLKTVATLRLGRVMLAAGEIEPALKLIGAYTDQKAGKFAGLYQELKGDLLAASKRYSEARDAYQSAKSLGENSTLLELKLNDLPAEGS
jgi:predicted negative regulator of RcsB-dependent stress response